MSLGTILYVGNFELPDKNAAAHRVVNNAKIFRELGFRVALLGTVRDESFSGYRPCAAELAGATDLSFYERAYPASTADWIRQLYDVTDVRAVAEAYDDLKLIIAYNVPFATFKALKKEFEKTGVRVAYDCTEWNGYAEGSLPKRLYKRHDEKQIRRKLGKICHDMIVISSAMERAYARSSPNLLRLPPLVDVDDPIWRQERAAEPGVFEFLFAGTVSNKERLDRVVEAFCSSGISGARLRVVGLTGDEFAAVYPGSADAVSDERITFDGYITHAETVKRVLSCSCFVFIREPTSRNVAGFPTKFAEAFTCGVPIITTDVSDVAVYIDSPDKSIIITDVSVESIRAALVRAAEAFRGQEPALRGEFDHRNYIARTREWISKTLI